MIRILSKGLLSTQSLLLANMQTSPLILRNDSEHESESKNGLEALKDWEPTEKIDQELL